jgi:two-component system sensor histidine kinase FlrB
MQTAIVPDDAHFTSEQQSLREAFGAFSSAAETLERSYISLGTEVCRLRKELEQERDLRRRREALAEISALLAHEIRNPLASMELFAGLLADSALAAQEKGWVDQIRSGLRILSATVNNILEFHSQRPLELVPTDLNQVLRAVESLLAPIADRVHMRWTADYEPQPLWIRADRHRLQQVFLNLALNAFRFAAQGGVLTVRTCKQDSSALVSFEDKGPGIPAAVLDKIFDARVTTRAGGTGLGLTVAKHIVEQHKGRIRVSSEPGQTRFAVELPLAPAPGVGQ